MVAICDFVFFRRSVKDPMQFSQRYAALGIGDYVWFHRKWLESWLCSWEKKENRTIAECLLTFVIHFQLEFIEFPTFFFPLTQSTQTHISSFILFSAKCSFALTLFSSKLALFRILLSVGYF